MVMLKKVNWVILSFSLSFTLAFPHLLLADAKKNKEKQNFEKLEQKLGQQKNQLKTISLQERSLHREYKVSSDKIEALLKEIVTLDIEEQKLAQRIELTNGNIQKVVKDIESKKTAVAKRLRQLYIWGEPSFLRSILTSETLLEMRQKHWLVRSWIARDSEMLGNYKYLVENLLKNRSNLEKDQKVQKKLLSDLELKKRELEYERQAKGSFLALMKNQREYYEKSIQELEDAQKNLQKLVETLDREEARGQSRFIQMKGKLFLPVRGKLERRYGASLDPKFKTKIYHKGIDLRASLGSEVQAAFDGKIVYADWFVGYGKVLIIDHGGGYFTLYAHLLDFTKSLGDSVVVGETIARVGDSGSLKGAYLYFELRRKGISEDPWPWFPK